MFNEKNIMTSKSLWMTTLAYILIAVLVFVGGCLFVKGAEGNEPIAREAAVAYTGQLESFENYKNYSYLDLQNGIELQLHPHAHPSEVYRGLNRLEAGTILYVLVNPNNGYVVEIRTEDAELLNFDAAQADIQQTESTNHWFGVGLCAVAVVGVIVLVIDAVNSHCFLGRLVSRRGDDWDDIDEDDDEETEEGEDDEPLEETPALRYADLERRKHRMLLEARRGGYHIQYVRVKHVNELVVNGVVYDEHKGVFEFAHCLLAVVNGHEIEAGLTHNSESYIMLDGRLLEKKGRLF